MPWLIVAALVGASLGLIELVSATKPRLYLKTAAWVMARVSVDALAAAFAYPLLTDLVGEASGVSAAALAVTAGSSAPLILRSQIIQLGQHRLPFGPLYYYQRFRELADITIRKKSATAESDYVWTKVVPTLSRGLELTALRERTRTYLATVGGAEALVVLLDSIVDEAGTTRRVKVAAIVTMLMEHKHHGHVRQLVRQARRVRRERQRHAMGGAARRSLR